MSTPHPDRVILIACSAAKLRFRDPTPAYRVYNGPLWRTLRAETAAWAKPKRASFIFPFVIVLSAKYGFVFDGTPIEYYDQELTAPRAAEILAEPALLEGLKVQGTAEVLLAGGKLYRETMRRALAQVGYRGEIVEPSPARGIGDIRAAMKAFIAASPRLQPKLL